MGEDLVVRDGRWSKALFIGLEIVEQDGALLTLLTPIPNDDARAVDDLASVAFTVESA